MENSKYIICDCGAEILHLLYEEGEIIESTDRKYDDEIYLSLFRMGYSKKPSLVERIKYAWYHLTTGKAHEDQMILTIDEASKLKNWLDKNIN